VGPRAVLDALTGERTLLELIICPFRNAPKNKVANSMAKAFPVILMTHTRR